MTISFPASSRFPVVSHFTASKLPQSKHLGDAVKLNDIQVPHTAADSHNLYRRSKAGDGSSHPARASNLDLCGPKRLGEAHNLYEATRRNFLRLRLALSALPDRGLDDRSTDECLIRQRRRHRHGMLTMNRSRVWAGSWGW